jgi:CelD/BcsL family acetyltransferase involved in cellulose biosynthesis
MNGMTLRIEKLSGPLALETLSAEWESLDAELYPRTPFTSPLWINLWWKHFQQRRYQVRDEFFCHTLRETDGRLVAIAPMMVTHRPAAGPLRIRLLQFFGADPSITEIRGVICRADRQNEVVEALTHHLNGCRDEWDVLWWTGIRAECSVYDTLVDRGELTTDRELPDYVLLLPETWDKLRATVSSNMRKNVRKSYELLEQDGHAFTFRAVARSDEVGPAIQRFFVLHAARADVSDMVLHPNKFANHRNQAFFIEFAQLMAERGALRIFELTVGGSVVASRVAFALGSELYCYFAGYDPAWRRYSVMTTLMCETIKWAIDNGFRLINLSTGKDLSKVRWRPAEIVFRDAMQVSPTVRGRLAFFAYDNLVRQPRLRALQQRAADLMLDKL